MSESGKANRDLVLGNIKRALDKLPEQKKQLADCPPSQSKFGVKAFKQSLRDSNATFTEVKTLADVPQAVAAYCKQENLGLRIAVEQSELAKLAWKEAGITTFAKWEDDLSLAVTGCRAALAETGQLLVTEKSNQAWLSLVASNHVAVVDMATLSNSLNDLGSIMATNTPATATLVHGPSRTADIEQTLVLGAHGPCKLHAILVSKSKKQVRTAQ